MRGEELGLRSPQGKDGRRRKYDRGFKTWANGNRKIKLDN